MPVYRSTKTAAAARTSPPKTRAKANAKPKVAAAKKYVSRIFVSTSSLTNFL